MAIQGSYQAMLDYARRAGLAGTIDAVNVGGFGTGGTYEFAPSGGGGGGGSMGNNLLTSLYQKYQKMENEAKKFNLSREKEVRGTYADILGRLAPGGAFEKSELAGIEAQAENLVGKETQNLISSGLFGTTTAASIPTRVATEFTRPARMKLEDLLEQRRTEAKLGLAGFVERIQNPYPDYNALIQAMAAQGNR